ncbi:MAG: cytochrome b/b6 domain-containing protein [Alphaproteobacteria bacterium]|nr:cytochrome b/b6 domain-containing protein [Alphaproteobacteria bacterium]
MFIHRQTLAQFSHLSITLHWIIAGSMMGSMAIQYYAVYFAEEAVKAVLFMTHRSLGLLSFGLSVFFVLLKSVDRRPPVRDVPQSAMGVYKIVKYSLFALPSLLFISGWLIFDLKDKDFYFFGHLIHAPDICAKNLFASAEARLHHKLLSAYAVVILVGHAGAAFFHHFIVKDKTLWRMLPLRVLLPKTRKGDVFSKD